MANNNRTKSVGRPSVFTPDVLSKLEAAFCNDFTDQQALEHAGISSATYYRWLKHDDKFRERIRRAQSYPIILAKRAVIAAIKEGDGKLALRFLERRQAERYCSKTESLIPLPTHITVILPGSKQHPRFCPQMGGGSALPSHN